ncbi:MAG: AMP-binding protein [Flavobacteriales bacterium]|nr:AMP-binding protein [Flavobacteriales bacterium]MCX7767890.1 AMP-binding protein [Flavobacteriales bacterium]MDW8409294.1 AMP-binding protein [Flavobacteriales bacterium]
MPKKARPSPNSKPQDNFNLPPKLLNTLSYLSKYSPYYKKLLARHSRKPLEKWTWEIFRALPLTTKSHLIRHPEDFFCISSHRIKEWSSTSGTTGEPLYVPLSEGDLRRLARNEAWTFRMAGLRRGDVLQICITLDKRFMAGLAYWLGARKAGISVIRMGPGVLPLQWQTMHQRQVTALLAVPSFIPRLLEYAQSQGIDPQSLSVRTLIAVGEPTIDENCRPNALCQSITQQWPLNIVSTYASTELQTAYTECPQHTGLHAQDDLVYTEILDDEGRPVEEGQAGQLVFTHFGVEAMPMLRYATGDIVRVWRSPCPCGLTSLRIGPVVGRRELRLKVNGTTIYPEQYVRLLNDCGLSQQFQLTIAHEKEQHDKLMLFISEKAQMRVTYDFFLRTFRDHNLPVPEIHWIPDDLLVKKLFPESKRKPQVILDLRNSMQNAP